MVGHFLTHDEYVPSHRAFGFIIQCLTTGFLQLQITNKEDFLDYYILIFLNEPHQLRVNDEWMAVKGLKDSVVHVVQYTP